MKFKDKNTISSNTLTTDYTATSLAESLLAKGTPIENIEILPIGNESRAYAKEIVSAYSYVSEHTDELHYRINTNHEGLYDMLPEGLFHTLPAGKEMLDEDHMILDIKTKRQEEKEARQFFAPFELEINQLRLLLKRYETQLDLKTDFEDLSNLMRHSWKELTLLNNRQKLIWMHFIPEIQQCKNNLKSLQEFLCLLTLMPIHIERKSIQRIMKHSEQEPIIKSLGDAQLGVDTVTMNRYEHDIDRVYLTVGPTTPQLIKPFLPYGQGETIIKMIIDYMLPAQTELCICYDFIPELKHSHLFADSNKSTTILGHTSYL